MKIAQIDPFTDRRWDTFIEENPSGTIFHHSEWAKVIRSTYKHQLLYLALEDKNKELLGVAPFVLIKSPLTGKRLVSLPFATYCDPILPEGGLDAVLHQLLAFRPDIDYVELKVLDEVEKQVSSIFCMVSQNVTHILDLDAPLDELYRGFHKTCVRQKIRRAANSGLTCRKGEGNKDLSEFFRLHTQARKKHGLPPHPFRFFSSILNGLAPKGMASIYLVELDGLVISAGLVLRFKDKWYFEYCATDKNHLKTGTCQFLTWNLISAAHEAGAKYFDFGRSDQNNASLIKFKKRWGTKCYPVTSCYFPSRPTSGKEDSGKRKLLNMANRHLPNPLLVLEGRILYPHLG